MFKKNIPVIFMGLFLLCSCGGSQPAEETAPAVQMLPRSSFLYWKEIPSNDVANRRTIHITDSIDAKKAPATVLALKPATASWSEMQSLLEKGLSASADGWRFWGTDVRGLEPCADSREWAEMQIRWHQWASLCPLYMPERPWPVMAEETIVEAISAANEFRSTLITYLYELNYRAETEGYIPTRPLSIDFPGDSTAIQVKDQYMLGDAIMVCPVFTYGARSRKAYLPEGCSWLDFYSGEFHEGGTEVEVEAPLTHIPIFVREGSLVVLGEAVSSGNDKQVNLEILSFGGKDADFTIYEDNGVNFDYREGRKSEIPLHLDNAKKSLSVGYIRGDYPGIIDSRNMNFVLFSDGQFMGSDQIEYDGKRQEVAY